MVPVSTLTGPVTCAFFLPEVCDVPLWLVWPTSYDDMYASIHTLKGGCTHFLHVLTTMQPILTPWIMAVQATWHIS